MTGDLSQDTANRDPDPWLVGVPGQEVAATYPGEPIWREWLRPVILFLVTLLSTMYAGLFYVYGDVGFFRMAAAVLEKPSILWDGASFSFTLVAILLAHEMGHFLACRYYGVRCTPPFFIPLPISYAGTLGAFIRIKSPFQHKRALFDVGIAGPLAGFALVVPALFIGIASSRLIAKGVVAHGTLSFGEPLLFQWVGRSVLGYVTTRQDMIAHPMAMAAWFGLLATSLNLFPIWQLDGGHIAYAMFGRETQKLVSIAAAISLMLVSFAGWPIPSYLLFACMVLYLGMRSRFYHPPALDENDRIGPGRMILGLIAFLILLISFTPVPIYLS